MHEAQQCDLTSWDKNKLRGSRHVTTSKHSPEEKEQLQRVRGRCGWERSVHELWRASRTAGLLAGEVLGWQRRTAAETLRGNVAQPASAQSRRRHERRHTRPLSPLPPQALAGQIDIRWHLCLLAESLGYPPAAVCPQAAAGAAAG